MIKISKGLHTVIHLAFKHIQIVLLQLPAYNAMKNVLCMSSYLKLTTQRLVEFLLRVNHYVFLAL